MNMKNTYIKIKGQSKYASKWNIGVYDENGNYTCKGFPTKKEAEAFASELDAKGYKKENNILSWD